MKTINSTTKLIYKIFLSVILLLSISACKDRGCIDADDFGFPKFNVSARGETIFGQRGNQISSWLDTNQILNGSRLVILVQNGEESSWCSWFGTKADRYKLAEVIKNSPQCQFENNDMCTTSNPLYLPLKGYEQFYDRSMVCLFTKGIGLYGLITPEENNPNLNEAKLRRLPTGPDSATFHLGQGLPNTDGEGDEAGGYNDSPPISSGQLYLKIVDRFYSDNSGKYKVTIKNGTAYPGKGPIAQVIHWIKSILDDAVKTIYNNLIKDSDFLRSIRALLTLYIIFVAISFIFGISKFTHKELFIHLFKISILVQLSTTESSWNFFNDTLFTLGKEGVDELICIVTSSVTGSDCSSDNAMSYFDRLLTVFFSDETSSKITALIFTSFFGFILFFAMWIAIFMYLICLCKAVVFYLLAYIGMCLLIILFPVFVPFILFSMTKDLFQGWTKQVISYAVQPIMVFAAVGLMTQVIVHELHTLLGYKICWQRILYVGDLTFLSGWVPVKPRTSDADLRNIYVPELWIKNEGGNPRLCDPFECKDLRFPDLPFLIPDISKTNSLSGTIMTGAKGNRIQDTNTVDGNLSVPAPYLSPSYDDQDRIDQIARGKYVTMTDVMVFILIIYVMMKFNATVPTIAKGLSGGVNNMADLGQGTQGLINGAFKVGEWVVDKPYRAFSGSNLGLRGDIRENIYNPYVARPINFIQDKVGGSIDGAGRKIKQGASRIPVLGTFPAAISNHLKQGDELVHSYQDSIGRKWDSIKEIASTAKENAKYESTGGIFGESATININDDKVRTKLDAVSDRFVEAFEVPKENRYLVKNELNKINTTVGKASTFTKIAVGAAIINPYAGAVVGAVGLASVALKLVPAVKNLGRLARKGLPTNLTPGEHMVDQPEGQAPIPGQPSQPAPRPPGSDT